MRCERCRKVVPSTPGVARCERCFDEIAKQLDAWATQAARYILVQMALEVA
jgi:hypothetical protein